MAVDPPGYTSSYLVVLDVSLDTEAPVPHPERETHITERVKITQVRVVIFEKVAVQKAITAPHELGIKAAGKSTEDP